MEDDEDNFQEAEDHFQAEPAGNSSRMNDLKTSLKKLGDSNYAVWKFRMELVLIQEDLFGVVSEEKPENPNPAWKAKDEKARALIGLSVEDGQLCHIIKAGSSKDMWDGLKQGARFTETVFATVARRR